jgi:hypothetical protein
MSKFNGHKNWNHWNVSLWINNDEWLYRQAVAFQRRRTKDEAARDLMDYLREMGQTETPDGAPYSFSSIRAAMVGM